jgi:hypothetical protein
MVADSPHLRAGLVSDVAARLGMNALMQLGEAARTTSVRTLSVPVMEFHDKGFLDFVRHSLTSLGMTEDLKTER